MFLTADGIGSSDCESIGDALLAQPVNALTSFAYVVVGAIVVVVALRGRRAIAASVVYGSCVAAIGFGSVLFHGPQTRGSQVLHDLPILITALFIVVADLALVRPQTRPWVVFAAASVAATAITVVDAGIGAAVTGAAVAAIVALEFVVYRRRLRDIPPKRQLMVYGVIAAVAATAGAAYLLGRTGSPACDPDGVLQFHGLWHVVSAGMFGAWWWLAFGEHSSSVGRRAGGS